MKQISTEAFPEWNKAGLLQFLSHCQQAAQADGHMKVASISLQVKHIDPLAVLESIYEPDELHFYMEHPNNDEAVAGAEAIVSHTFEGPSRFEEAKHFWQELSQHFIAIGDVSLPFAGPHCFCSFAFYDEVENEDTPFPPATIFIPRWQVARKDGVYSAVANIPITEEMDLHLVVEKVWAAHSKFSAFEYDAVPHKKIPGIDEERISEVGGDAWFVQSVQTVLGQIEQKAFEKIVLARAIDLKAAEPFQPLEALNNLREVYPSCYAFSLGNGKGDSFIGATPERLLKVDGRKLLTEAIAGSAARGKNAREDAQCGKRLLNSEKDQREHQFVVESILRRLKELGITVAQTSHSQLLKLHNVQHLKTYLEAHLPEAVHLLDILKVLHPTPAVGGMPRKAACAEIGKHEPFPRGIYAGAVGWFNHEGDGEFVVAIRSALMQGKEARLYAGVGIVKGSDPEQEKKETNWKLHALLNALRYQ